MEKDAFGGDFVREVAQGVSALQIHARSRRKVQNEQLWGHWFGTYPFENSFANVVDVEIDQPGFWPEDHDARGQLVVRMPLAIGEPPRARNASQKGDMRVRSGAQQLYERNDRAEQHAAQKAEAEHANESCHRRDEFRPVAAPKLPERRDFEQAGHGYQHDGGQ